MTHLSRVFAIAFCGIFAAHAQQPASLLQRHVDDQTIISRSDPAADLTFDEDYDYIGGQRLTLYGVAEAEQYLFARAADDGGIDRFYWVQFERFLPGNDHTYNYQPVRTIDIGALQFIYDTSAYTDYAASNRGPAGSDSAAITALLARHRLSLPRRTARVRMFHLPTTDRRSELMIIYGEALPAGSQVPASEQGVSLDQASPETVKVILQHFRQGLTIRKR